MMVAQCEGYEERMKSIKVPRETCRIKVVHVHEKTLTSVLMIGQIAIDTRDNRIRASTRSSGVVQVYHRFTIHLVENSHGCKGECRMIEALRRLIMRAESGDG